MAPTAAAATHTGSGSHVVTNAAVGPDGDLFVSDGYGNARVHRFSADGELKASWGEPGSGPGKFDLPHSNHAPLCSDF